MITIDKSIVKVVNSYVKKQFDDLEIVGIECEYVVSLWDENTYNPFKKVNIVIKNDIGFNIDKFREIIFIIGDSGRLVSSEDISNIPLSLNIDFKILEETLS